MHDWLINNGVFMRICLIFFLLLQFAFSQGVLNVKEEDGDPSVHGVWQWEVSNGSLTDNNSGKITVKTANASSYYVGVAASDAANKELYDYVCDGVNDEVQINAAIDDAEAAPGGLGGLVQLSDGGFVIDAPISITTGLIHLKGQGGYNTRLTMGNSANCDLIVYDSEVQNLTPLIIEDMYFHGNTANNTSGRAFYDSQGTYPIQDVWIIRCAFFYFDDEVLSFSHKGAKVFQCVFEYNDEEAILFNTGGNDHQVTNCLFASNQKESIIIGSAVTLCKIIGNHISMGLSGTPAMAIDGAGNIVTGNTFRDNSSGSNQAAGIEMRDEADKCIISNNIFLEGDNHMTPAIDCLAGAEHSEIKDNKFIFSNDNPTYATVAENNFMGILNRQGGGDYWVRKDNNDFMIGDGTNYMQITDTGDFTSYGTGDYLVFGDRFAFRYALDEDLGLYFEDDVAGGALETKSLEGVTSTSINFTTGLFSTLTGIDGIGAVDLDYGSADILDNTFISDGGTIVVDGNIQASGGTLLLGGIDGTNNENLIFDFESTENVTHMSSTSGGSVLSSAVSIRFNDWYSFYWGTGYDTRMLWADSTYDSLQLGIGVGSTGQTGYFFFIEKADLGQANRYPTAFAADPTFRIYSSDAAVATDYIEFFHDQSVSKIWAGSGEIQMSASDATNYLAVEADGTIEFNGTATTWDDLQVNISTVRVPAANAPTWTAYKGSQVLAFSKAADEIIYFTAQLPHSYKEGSNIEFHLHTVYPDANANEVRWNFTHSWANIGVDFPGETTVNIDVTASQDADNHTLDDIADPITGSGKTISSILLCSLQREGSHANDDYDNDVYLIALDFHFESDTIGSRTEGAK